MAYKVMPCPVRALGQPVWPVKSYLAFAYTFLQFSRPKSEKKSLSPGLQASLSPSCSSSTGSLWHMSFTPDNSVPSRAPAASARPACVCLVPLCSVCPRTFSASLAEMPPAHASKAQGQSDPSCVPTLKGLHTSSSPSSSHILLCSAVWRFPPRGTKMAF